MKFLLTIVIFFSFLNATTHYPNIFSSQGDNLYKSSTKIMGFKQIPSLSTEVTAYIDNIEKTKKLGYKADTSDEKQDKVAYLKALRSLQKTHDKVLNHSIIELHNSIKVDNYQKFLALVDSGIYYYQNKPILKEKIFTYYKKNKHKKNNTTLNRLIKEEENSKIIFASTSYADVETPLIQEQTPKKEIILLSSPNCIYCKKAKSVLSSTGKYYKEYNIKDPKGKELFKKYNGTGVPIIIAGKQVLRGFSKDAILKAIQ